MTKRRLFSVLATSGVVRRFTASVVVLSMMLGVALLAARPLREVPVLVTFGNGPTDSLRSDGLLAPGYEADYANGLENVLAVLQPSGSFRFFTQNNTQQPATRAMCFDFGAQSVPFAPARCVNVGQPMHAYASGDVPIQNLTYGQSVRKLTRFAWDEPGYRYRLGYGTDMDADGLQDSPEVTVTCIAPASTSQPCTSWVLAPATDGTAALFRFALTGGKKGNVTEGPAEYLGAYLMPFVQTITVKP